MVRKRDRAAARGTKENPLDGTVPCKFCGDPTFMRGTKSCNQCWEVVHRLERFLSNKAGQEHVRTMLQHAELLRREEA